MSDNKQTEPKVLQKLAQRLGTTIRHHRLTIPENFGQGYCAGFVFNEYIRLLILNYELHKDLVVENPDAQASGRIILFKFQHIFGETGTPAVLIATRSLDPEFLIPVYTHTATINIEVDARYLNDLLDRSVSSPIIKSLLEATQPLLFEQLIVPSLQRVVEEIVAGPADPSFQIFFLRVKAEELVCRLLMELEKRGEKQLYDLNARDIQMLYQVKAHILARLETPPGIPELARFAGMSPTKLKRLFKQIFGSSIFSYYQLFRLNEAARLLKQEKLPVSSVGYQMGFTNLSHFSRVFQAHIGMKPKQYSRIALPLAK